MTAPYYGLSTDPNATTTLQPPPDEDLTTQQIVAVLLAGYSLKRAAGALSAIVPGISLAVWTTVLSRTGGTSGHTAHAPLNAFELEPRSLGAQVARSVARREAFYRGAYIGRAVARVQRAVNDGKTLVSAMRDELPQFRKHEAARRWRLHAGADVGRAAERFGPLLGWYLDPLVNNEPECIVANGHNFYATQGTVIGEPGTVHRFCACHAGPPIPGAGMVNDAIAASRQVLFEAPKKYGLKAAS